MGGVPKKPGNILKEVALPVFTAPVLAAKAAYKATDPLGAERMKKQGEEAAQQQNTAMQAQAEAAKQALLAPRPTAPDSGIVTSEKKKKQLYGLASTISGAGMMGTAGGKTTLGS